MINGLKSVTSSYSSSQVVAELQSEIESKYDVFCEGSSLTLFPDISKTIMYRAKCIGELRKVSLNIKSKFSYSANGFDFKLKSYKVKIHPKEKDRVD